MWDVIELFQNIVFISTNNIELSVFKIGFVKCCRAIDLDREENRFVTKFRTDIFGLNRMKVVK